MMNNTLTQIKDLDIDMVFANSEVTIKESGIQLVKAKLKDNISRLFDTIEFNVWLDGETYKRNEDNSIRIAGISLISENLNQSISDIKKFSETLMLLYGKDIHWNFMDEEGIKRGNWIGRMIINDGMVSLTQEENGKIKFHATKYYELLDKITELSKINKN